MRALVVDDSFVTRRILVGMLMHECEIGEVEQASDGETALAIWQEKEFDVVLLDMHLPKCSGLDVLKGIRAFDKKLPVIMVTTESERPLIVQAITHGASDYIVKPFSSTTVVRKVTTAMNSKYRRR